MLRIISAEASPPSYGEERSDCCSVSPAFFLLISLEHVCGLFFFFQVRSAVNGISNSNSVCSDRGRLFKGKYQVVGEQHIQAELAG